VGKLEDLTHRSFKMLERAEGYFAAAAYKEQHEPPYKQGKAYQEFVGIRDLLADLERVVHDF
jgi:hypothetical protein